MGFDDDTGDEDIPHYKVVLEQEMDAAQEEFRAKIKERLCKDIFDIKQELLKLILINKDAEDLEKLDRAEFVVDKRRRDQIMS